MAMELDLETFLVALYVIVDDLYQSDIEPRMPACGGPPAQMSDSEVLCLGLAHQGGTAVPGETERAFPRNGGNLLGILSPVGSPQRPSTGRLDRRRGAFILTQAP